MRTLTCESWLVAVRLIELRSSAIRWKLVKRLRRIEVPVRPGNRNVSITVLCQFGCLFKGRGGCFAPKCDAAANIRC
jgi:hypothetical protein